MLEKTIRIGGLILKAPADHKLDEFQADQPFRDDCVGIIARALQEYRPGACVLDIGANIGDTAAHIRKFCDVTVHCVEPHPMFFSYLKRNAERIPGIGSLHHVFVGDGDLHRGELVVVHGSTAAFRTDELLAAVPTVRIEDLGVADIGMVKVDADGFDFTILESHLGWLALTKPLLFFEDEIRDEASEVRSNQLLSDLSQIGYRYWVVFDDRGYFVTSTADVGVVQGLNRYLRRTWIHDRQKRVCNYDILAVPENGSELYEKVRDFYIS